MRKYIYIGVFFLLCAGRASAQFTLVSGTVADTSGLAYSCGTISASIVNNNGQSLYLNGVQFSPQPGSTKLGCPTDPTTSRTPGAYSLQLADNTQIKCGSGASIVTCATQTQWLFTINTTGIQPPLGTGPQVCTSQVTISGATQPVNVLTCPLLSNLSAGGPGGGFLAPGSTSLIVSSNCNGGVPGHTGNCYFMYQDAVIWSGCTWSAGGPPTTLTCQSTSPLCALGCASVTSNVATIVFGTGATAFNPVQAGWVAGHIIVVSQFTGADTFYNGTFTISSVTGTSVSYALVHANAGSTSNGSVVNTNVGPFKPTDCALGSGTGCTGTTPTKTGFATHSCFSVNPPACLASIPEGNISSFINQGQATINAAAATAGLVGGANGTTSFQYGTDDTANLSAAVNALQTIAGFNTGQPASIAFNCGSSMIQKAPFIFGGSNRMPFDIHGCGGEATALIPRQDFDYTGCGTNGGCIFEDDNSASANLIPIGLTDYFHDFLIYGGGYDCNGCNLGGKSGLYVSYAHHVENVTVQGWNWSTATPQAQRFIGIQNAGGRVVNSHSYNAGYATCQSIVFGSVGLVSIWDRVICAPGSNGPGMDVESGTTFIVGSNLEPGSSGINSGAISMFGGTLLSGGGNFLQGKVIIVEGNAHFNNDTFGVNGALLCGFNSSPAPNCYVTDSVSGAPPQIPTTGTTGPANLFDGGHNVWNGIPQVTTGTYIPPNPSPQGSCTGTSTANIAAPGIFVQPATAATRTCTSTTEVAIFQAPRAGTLQVLQCTATTGGVNASSGLVTVRVAPLATGTFAASGITATFGTTTSAIDITHTFAVTTGQFVSIAYTTQVAETLAGVSCTVALQ